MHVTAIIVAAGEGKRIGGPVSKSFLPMAGRPLVLRTLDRFFSTQSIEKVILVVADKELGQSQRLIASDPISAIGPGSCKREAPADRNRLGGDSIGSTQIVKSW